MRKCDHNGIISCGQYNCEFCLSRSFASQNPIKTQLWDYKRNFCKPINILINNDRTIYFECKNCRISFELTVKEAAENEIICLDCTRKELFKKNKEIKIMSSDDKPFKCKECNKSFKFKYQITKHKTSVAHISKINGSVYKCSEKDCDFETNIKGNYMLHKLNTHCSKEERKKGYPFYCEKCDVGSLTKKGFDKHLITKSHQNNI